MDVVKEIGLPALFEQTAEECIELAHVCLKYARYLRDENPTSIKHDEIIADFIEELADVDLCTGFVQDVLQIDHDDILHTQAWKLSRMESRIHTMKELKERNNEQSRETKSSEE